MPLLRAAALAAVTLALAVLPAVVVLLTGS
jgi:hypothetical protein